MPERPTPKTEKTIRTTWIITAIAGFYYVILLTNGTFDFLGREVLGLVFNSMFSNMLHLDFSIDPEVLRYKTVFEAMVKDGKTYMYFGVFPAFTRLFFMPFVDLSQTYLSRIVVLCGLLVSIYFQVKILLRVFCTFEPNLFITRIFYLLLIGLLFGCPYLIIASNASVYHEPIVWASAAVAAFNYLLIDTVLKNKTPNLAVLNFMAIAAGICLLSRVSVAIGIYIAVVCLATYSSLKELYNKRALTTYRKKHRHKFGAIMAKGGRPKALRLLCIPIATLLLFGFVYLGINYARWGNPFMSSYFEGYVEKSSALEKYGILNIRRIPFAVKYYMFGSDEKRSMTRIEGPGASMVATNSLFLLLGIFGIVRLWQVAKKQPQFFTLIGIGITSHAANVILLLMFAALTTRYRLDLWGLVFLCAMIGFYFIAQQTEKLNRNIKSFIFAAAIALTVIGAVSSHLIIAKYKLTWFSMEKPRHEITEIMQTVVQ